MESLTEILILASESSILFSEMFSPLKYWCLNTSLDKPLAYMTIRVGGSSDPPKYVSAKKS